MDITLAIIIGILIIVFFVFLKLLKSVLKALSVVVIIFVVIGVVIGIIIYSDLNNFEKLVSGKKVILYQENNNFKAGVEIPQITEVNQVLVKGTVVHYSEQELSNFDTIYSNDELESITPEDGLLIIAKSDSIKNESSLKFEDITFNLSSDDFERIIGSETVDEEISILTKDLNESSAEKLRTYVSYNFDSAQKVKNIIFYEIFLESAKENTGLFLIKNIRDNNIEVFPEFTSFKSFQFIPIGLSDTITGMFAAEGS